MYRKRKKSIKAEKEEEEISTTKNQAASATVENEEV
jgi:hypothetical protein